MCVDGLWVEERLAFLGLWLGPAEVELLSQPLLLKHIFEVVVIKFLLLGVLAVLDVVIVFVIIQQVLEGLFEN